MQGKGMKIYNEAYLQGNIPDENARALESIQGVKNIKNLEGAIVNLSPIEVEDIIEDYERYKKKHKSMEGYKPKEKVYRQGKLKPYQTVGVAFMYFAGSALLGDEVGLGKTVQVAGLVNVLRKEAEQEGREFRYCFLTEKTSVEQIRKKMIQFTGEYVKMLESGQKSVIKGYMKDIEQGDRASIVGSHSLIQSSEFLVSSRVEPFDLIIIDESSIVKEASSQMHKKCKGLFKYHEKKILLNATPLENDVEEFYNQLNLLDESYLMPKEGFMNRYCVRRETFLGFETIGYKNTEEFKQLVSLRYIARTREELGAEYKDNSFRVVSVPLSKEQKELQKKTSLYSMVYDYPHLVDRTIPFNVETTPKAQALLDILGEIEDIRVSKALVYCRLTECQESLKGLLEEKGYTVGLVNGKVKIGERNKVVDDFLKGRYDIIITSIQKGLDINNCDNTIIYTIDPNPSKMVQVEGRMTREFDVVGKNLYMLVSEGREQRTVEKELNMKVEASKSFIKTGKSMIVQAIEQEGEKRDKKK